MILAKVPKTDALEHPHPEHPLPDHHPFKEAAIDASLRSLRVRLEVEQGSVIVEDAAGTKWHLDEVAAEVLMPSEKKHAVEAAFTGKIAPEGSEICATTQVDIDSASGKVSVIQSKLEAKEFPLEFINPVCAWVGDPARLGGKLTGNAILTYEQAGNSRPSSLTEKYETWWPPLPSSRRDHLELSDVVSHLTAKVDEKGIELSEGSFQCVSWASHRKRSVSLE